MPSSASQTFLRELDKKLWTAADKLRSNLDAAVYKHAVLGLIFLKYVSDSFAQRQAEIEVMLRDPDSDSFLNPKGYGNAFSPEYLEAIRGELEERDYYIEKNVFWVPPLARWKTIQDSAKLPAGAEIKERGRLAHSYKFTSLGKLIDDALEAVENENPELKNVFDKKYIQLRINSSEVVSLIDLIATVQFQRREFRAKDILSYGYEDFVIHCAELKATDADKEEEPERRADKAQPKAAAGHLTLSQLEQYLSRAAWILKGPIGASDFKAYIFPMLFFKRISDVYDEEFQTALEESGGDEEYAALPEFHRFVIPAGCHWDDVRETTSNVGLKIESSLREIESANQDYLYGIFGDAQWSNKNSLPDRLLVDLVEHFSQYTLSRALVAPDMLGQAYEYLIKHFADLTNKKAGEFYTPRSVVHLMGLIIDPHERESIYDPACGTGGMLIESIDHLKENGEDYRTLKLYGQEKNLTSSSIARMNMFLHGVEDFKVARGDTLRSPAFFTADGLQTFDCVIANPPFSLKEWGANAWANDPYGRNIAGVPPQGNGDMAWVQHMIKSMRVKTGRMAVVLPHGALFRKAAEGRIREALLEMDLLEAVIGLGPNIFYGTQLAACIMVFRSEKPKKRKKQVLFIDASEQIRVGRAQNFLEKEHVERIYGWYRKFEDVENHVKVATLAEIAENDHNLNIPLYVEKVVEDDLPTVKEALDDLKTAWAECQKTESHLKTKLREFGISV